MPFCGTSKMFSNTFTKSLICITLNTLHIMWWYTGKAKEIHRSWSLRIFIWNNIVRKLDYVREVRFVLQSFVYRLMLLSVCAHVQKKLEDRKYVAQYPSFYIRLKCSYRCTFQVYVKRLSNFGKKNFSLYPRISVYNIILQWCLKMVMNSLKLIYGNV